MNNPKTKIQIVLFLMLLSMFHLKAVDKPQGIFSQDEFRKIVILENGRKKPIDTYAQNILKQFSGRSKFEGKSAIFWLSRVLFNPRQSFEDRIFLINNPEVLTALGIAQTGKRDRYSFSQINNKLEKLKELAFSVSRIKSQDRTYLENEIMFLYHKLYVYRLLTESFGLYMPDENFSIPSKETKEFLHLPVDRDTFSFFEFVERKKYFSDMVIVDGSNDPVKMNQIEKDILRISNIIKSKAKYFRDYPLTILYQPVNNIEKWINPWECLYDIFKVNKPISQELLLLKDMVKAYSQGNQRVFDTTIQKFKNVVATRFPGSLSYKKISLEVFYNKIDPFYKSKFFYGFSFLFLILSFLVSTKYLTKISFILLSMGFLLHTGGIVARMVIMDRPPVTNLFETFVFTGWITVLLGMMLEIFKKRNMGIMTGSISGLVLLMIAGKYSLEGDTMGMLVAVLDSNFWLATHVISITIGYAGIVISGVLGHLYVFQKIFIPQKVKVLRNTFQAIYATQAFGLIFTFLGTVLGGIWADQSWGRFWGWDPKENGALVIILWSAIIFHARLAGIIGELGFSLGSIIGIVSVALAWFGVNLLGVGLHSYGFTGGIATALFIFVLAEFLFVLIGAFFVKRRSY